MGNVVGKNPIVLDTFTSIIDFQLQFPTGMKIQSIEWSKPTDVSHTALIKTGGSGGVEIFDEQCTVANQSIKSIFGSRGLWFKPLYIAQSGVGSGKIIIILD